MLDMRGVNRSGVEKRKSHYLMVYGQWGCFCGLMPCAAEVRLSGSEEEKEGEEEEERREAVSQGDADFSPSIHPLRADHISKSIYGYE
jgi:hypothetical protein